MLSDCESELAFYSHYLRVERIVGALEIISKSLREAVKSLHAAPEVLAEVGNETVHCAAPRVTRRYMNPTKSSMSKARHGSQTAWLKARSSRRDKTRSGKASRESDYFRRTLSSEKKRRSKSPLARYPRRESSLCA